MEYDRHIRAVDRRPRAVGEASRSFKGSLLDAPREVKAAGPARCGL